MRRLEMTTQGTTLGRGAHPRRRLAGFLALALSALPALSAQSLGDRLDDLIPDLASGEPGRLERADAALEALVFEAGRPGNERERRAFASALARKLEGELSARAKERILRRLEFLGKTEVVASLAKVLFSPAEDLAVRDAARRALEANPSTRAKTELRKAAVATEGVLRAAICRSLGLRRDMLAVGPLMEAARSEDRDVRTAAVEALARIGDEQCVSPVEEALRDARPEDVPEMRRAFLRLAHELAVNGDRGMARRLYARVMAWGPTYRAAALVGLAKAGLQSEIPDIVSGLSDPDPVVRGASREAAAILPARAMTAALLDALATASGDVRLSILEVLAARGDESAVQRLAELLETADASERLAVLDALGATASAEAAQALAGALGRGGEAAERAAALLVRSPAPDAGAVLAERFAVAPAAEKRSIVRVLAARGGERARAVAMDASRDGDALVRAEAYRALGRAGDATVLPVLLEALQSPRGDEEYDAIVSALAALDAEGKEAALLDACANLGDDPERKAAILEGLRGSRDPRALELFRKAAESDSRTVRLAGVEGMAAAGDASLLPLLLERGGDSDDGIAAAALRGSFALAGDLARTDPEKASRVYRRGLTVARRDEERAVALGGLAETAGPDALEAIEPYLRPGPLQRDAGRAALRLALRLPDDANERVVSIYRRVLDLDVDAATARQCVNRLRKLGVRVDPAREKGFVTSWWIAGPLPNPGGALWNARPAPETEGVDLGSPFVHGGETFHWRHHHESDPLGIIDLTQVVAAREEVGAYLYAEVTVPEPAEVLLKLGSDDQVACWLNGEKVHAHAAQRGVGIDQDTVAARLEKGANTLLLKVLNDGGGWGACFRITDREGRPLRFEQRED